MPRVRIASTLALRTAWLALAAGALQPARASASSWELEASAGLGSGTHFTLPAPFELEGLSFGGPYNVCDLPEDFCLTFGLGDVGYLRLDEYGWTMLGGTEVRRRVSGGFSLGFGALAGGARRRHRVSRIVLAEVIPTRPPEPGSLAAAADANAARQGRAGIGWLAYLHASARYERVFGESQSVYGESRRGTGVFIEGGAGVLPVFLGSDEVASGRRVAAVHGSLGARFRRRGHDLTLTVTHVRALLDAGDLDGGRFAWTLARLGVVFER